MSLAENSTQKKVEREVALANLTKAIDEKMTYISPNKQLIENIQIKKNMTLLKKHKDRKSKETPKGISKRRHIP